MHHDAREQTVSRLRALVASNPELAMDELESLVARVSVRHLSAVLNDLYDEVTADLGIDWHFTALQWKLSNREPRRSGAHPFMVWSFPFQQEGSAESETRYTTCLPFRFTSAWLQRGANTATR